VTVRSPLTVSPSDGEVKQSWMEYAAEGGLLVAQFPAASAGAGCTRGIGSAPTVSANATTTASALRVADRHANRVLCIFLALKLCNEDETPHRPVRPAPKRFTGEPRDRVRWTRDPAAWSRTHGRIPVLYTAYPESRP
jgi:hypothetical protein